MVGGPGVAARRCTAGRAHSAARARRRGLTIAGMVVALATAGITSVGLAAPAAAVDGAQAVATIHAQTDAHRQRHGRQPLVRNTQLDAVAASWSREQCRQGEMSHNPGYSQQIPRGWTRAAENVAYGYAAHRVVAAWIASPGHNANLLGDYTHIGIGYCEQGTHRFYTQVFARYPAALPGDRVPADIAPGVLSIAANGTLARSVGSVTGTLGGRSPVGTGWGSRSLVTGVGDLTGDGFRDVASRDASGRLRLHPGNGRGGYGPTVAMARSFGSYRLLLAPGDITGDGRGDLLAVGRSGTLYRFSPARSGALGPRTTVGTDTGWSALRHLVAPGDLDGDGRPDLLGVDASGRLVLFRGAAGGRFGPAQVLASGWHGVTALVAPGDMTGDGTPDVVARTSSGALRLHAGTGDGGVQDRGRLGSAGWSALRLLGPGPPAG